MSTEPKLPPGYGGLHLPAITVHIIEAMPCECRGLTGYERNVLMMSGYTCNRCAKLESLRGGENE